MVADKLSSLSVFLPAFNEEDNILTTLKDALAIVPRLTSNYEIIVINDGSTDNTASLVASFAKKHPQVKLISHSINRGYGAAVKTGLANATKDWIFFTDSDGQFKFNQLPQFVAARHKADIIIGYRRKRRDPLHRIFLAQILLKIWNRILFGLKVKDVDCAYKLFPQKVAQSIHLKTESAITVTEFLVKAQRQGFTFYELPVTHYPRRHGVQTGGNLKVILRAALDSFHLFRSLNKNDQN